MKTPFSFRKSKQLISLVLLIITNVLLFNKIELKILLPMILPLKFFYITNYSLLGPCGLKTATKGTTLPRQHILRIE